jgi:hypothetical protein
VLERRALFVGKFLFGFRFACEKKTLSLSVDLEPIEVIMVTAVALIRKYSQCSACQVPSFACFPDFGNNWQQTATEGLLESA